MPATENEFDRDYLTPTYEYYDDDHLEGTPDAPPEQLTSTPEIGDNYLNMEPATENDFDKDYLTPTYEYYDDDHQEGTPDAPPEQLTPTPEIGDNYLNMELILPRGGTLARGRVKESKRDHRGNVIGRSNANTILDTR